MKQDAVANFGWTNDQAPCSCAYIAPRIIALIKKLGIRRVLDVGAGNGVLCAMMADEGREVVGVEYDKHGIAIARQVHPRIPFYNFGVQDDPSILMADEKPFDAVISTEVVEHLYAPHLLPIYARGVLASRGYLIVSTPYHGYWKNLALSIFGKWDFHHTALWHGGHIKFWSRATLTKLLGENGFDVLEFHGVGRLPYLWKSMIVVARKRPPDKIRKNFESP